MEFNRKRNPVMDYLWIILGTTLLALSINVFFEPLEMVTGGVTGVSIVIKSVTSDMFNGGVPLWLTNLVINIPLFVLALLIKGKNFSGRSLFSTVFLSIALFYTQWFTPITHDILLGSVFGGVLAGIGLGLVFSSFATTGGTDLAASLIQHFFKHISVARIMMMLDAGIVLLGVLIFGTEQALYAIISIFITTKVIDAILDGLHFSKLAFIISEHHELITKRIFEVLDRGVTGLHGEGLYTNEEKKVIFCVVSKRQIVTLKEIVKNSDPKAFIIVTDVREVLGEGFIEYHAQENLSK